MVEKSISASVSGSFVIGEPHRWYTRRSRLPGLRLPATQQKMINQLKLMRFSTDTTAGLSSAGVKKTSAGVQACICSVYPALTPHEIIAYAECMRLTPYELFANRKIFDQFKRFRAYAQHILSIFYLLIIMCLKRKEILLFFFFCFFFLQISK